MFCTRCGEQLKEDNLYCPSCGHKVERKERGESIATLTEKKPMPGWFKGLIVIAFLALVAVTAGIFLAQNPKKIVAEQLSLLRKKEWNRVYTHYTTQEFQSDVSFGQFQEFIEQNPILHDFLTYRLGKSLVRDQLSLIKAMLVGEDGRTTTVEYQLKKEEGKWKIARLILLNESSSFLPVSPEEAQEALLTIEKQLSLLANKEIEEAYQETTSEAFQEQTTEKEWENFVKERPILTQKHDTYFAVRGKVGDKLIIWVLLTTNGSTQLLENVLEKEGDQWRLWRQEMMTTFEKS